MPLSLMPRRPEERVSGGLIHTLPDLARMPLSESVCNTAKDVEAPPSRINPTLVIVCRHGQIQRANKLDCSLHPHCMRDCQALVGDQQFFRETPTHEGAPYRTARHDAHTSASRTLTRDQVQLIAGEPTCESSTSKRRDNTIESAAIAKVASKACGMIPERTRGVHTFTGMATAISSAHTTRRSRP